MLALKIEYLTGVCMATRHDDPSRASAEWPPHPDRLFSALVAAAAHLQNDEVSNGDAGIPDAALRALKWLEQQSWRNGQLVGPVLSVPNASRRFAPDVHMPSNPHEDEVWQKPKKGKPRAVQRRFDLRSLLPVHRKKAALPIPVVAPDDSAVFIVWPNAIPDEHISVLRQICEQVTYLGRSRSLVRVSVEENPPAPTHVPDALGQVQLRVPGLRRLDYLIEKHNRDGGKPEPCPPQRYLKLTDRHDETDVLNTVFGRMFIFQPRRGSPAIGSESTLKLTETLRKAVLSHVHAEACGCDRWNGGVPRPRAALECYAKLPALISGHNLDGSPFEEPHLAFIALPFVDSDVRHADGTIKGFAVVVPHTDDLGVLLPLARALSRLESCGLRIPAIGTWNLSEVPADDPPLKTLRIENWQGPSRHWTTVTPMAFGHFPKPKSGGEPQVILDSLAMVGVDPQHVVEIAVSRHSPLHGVPPSWCFKSLRDSKTKGDPRRMLRHVTLRFDRPIRGPVVLGCKRYFGLGLMRPLEER